MAVKVLILEDNPVARSFLCRVVRESLPDHRNGRNVVTWNRPASRSTLRAAPAACTASTRSS